MQLSRNVKTARPGTHDSSDCKLAKKASRDGFESKTTPFSTMMDSTSDLIRLESDWLVIPLRTFKMAENGERFMVSIKSQGTKNCVAHKCLPGLCHHLTEGERLAIS